MTRLVLLLVGMAAAAVIFFSPAKIGYNPHAGECGFTYLSRHYIDEGDYKVKAINPAPHDGGTGFIEVGEIKKFPRLKKHAWDLVVLAINKLRSTPYPGGE